MPVGAEDGDVHVQQQAGRVGAQVQLGVGLAAVNGFGPVSGPPFRSDTGRVHHRAGPIDRRLLAQQGLRSGAETGPSRRQTDHQVALT